MLCILGRKQKQDVSATIAALESEMKGDPIRKHQDLVRDPRDVSAAIAALMSEMEDLLVSLNSEMEVRPNPQNVKSEMEVHPIPQNGRCPPMTLACWAGEASSQPRLSFGRSRIHSHLDWMGTLKALIRGATHEWHGTLKALIRGTTHVPEWHDKEV